MKAKMIIILPVSEAWNNRPSLPYCLPLNYALENESKPLNPSCVESVLFNIFVLAGSGSHYN